MSPRKEGLQARTRAGGIFFNVETVFSLTNCCQDRSVVSLAPPHSFDIVTGMGYISSVFASRSLAIVSAGGATTSNWRTVTLTELGLTAGDLDQPDGTLSDDRFFSLLESIATLADGRAIGIRVGASMRCDDYGAFGLAFKSSVDLDGSFVRVARFDKVVTNVANFTVQRGARSSWMTVPETTSGRLGELMTIELALAAATSLSREVVGDDFAPRQVRFGHTEPASKAAAEDHFRCPVMFGDRKSGIEIDNRDLARVNRLGDSKISEFFDQHLKRELDERMATDTLAAQVRELVTRVLSEGSPKIETIASQLGMSRRTLQRRLADEHLVYSDLVEQARRDVATNLLKHQRYGLAEVAFLAGYSDQSTFTRAFRRWEGLTPADFRSEHQVH